MGSSPHFLTAGCAVEAVAGLRVGERFTLNGRAFTVADGCVSDYADGRRTMYVWNANGRRVLVTVRPSSRVEVEGAA